MKGTQNHLQDYAQPPVLLSERSPDHPPGTAESLLCKGKGPSPENGLGFLNPSRPKGKGQSPILQGAGEGLGPQIESDQNLDTGLALNPGDLGLAHVGKEVVSGPECLVSGIGGNESQAVLLSSSCERKDQLLELAEAPARHRHALLNLVQSHLLYFPANSHQ